MFSDKTIFLQTSHQTIWELWRVELSHFGYNVSGGFFDSKSLQDQLSEAIVALVEDEDQVSRVKALCPDLLVIRLVDNSPKTILRLPEALLNSPKLAFYLHVFLQQEEKNKKTRISD